MAFRTPAPITAGDLEAAMVLGDLPTVLAGSPAGPTPADADARAPALDLARLHQRLDEVADRAPLDLPLHLAADARRGVLIAVQDRFARRWAGPPGVSADVTAGPTSRPITSKAWRAARTACCARPT
jgi:hypothetical protein